MSKLEISEAVTEIFNLLRASNKYIDETTPWVLAKDEAKKERLMTVLYNLLESIRVSALFLSAYLPDTAESIKHQINNEKESLNFVDNNIYSLNEASPLFQRIDLESFKKEHNL